MHDLFLELNTSLLVKPSMLYRKALKSNIEQLIAKKMARLI
jgi:hypothetical protein